METLSFYFQKHIHILCINYIYSFVELPCYLKTAYKFLDNLGKIIIYDSKPSLLSYNGLKRYITNE